MQFKDLPTEKEFLKAFCLGQFNYFVRRKGDASVKLSDFEIYSIPGDEDHKYAYEVFNKNPGNGTRIHMYLNVAQSDDLSPFQLMLKPPMIIRGLGDEVWVTCGTLHQTHILNTNYRLNWIPIEESQYKYLLLESGYILKLENGGDLLLE
jgi:hypothetical protein